MTLERASELVKALRLAGLRNEAIDLFLHFDTFFRLYERDPSGGRTIEFVALCGFPIAERVRLCE